MGYMELVKSYSNQMRVVEAPASGGGLSQNGKFSYGYASSAGKRSSMEDFFETRIDTVDGIDGEIVGLFGVFDGHGGAKAAEYVKRHLFSNLITHPKFISDTKSAITDAYNHTDSELLKSDTKDAGSTASTAILVGDRLLVANVGDSRAVICRGGNAFAVSRDHKPDQSDERERIENAGGFVMWAGTWRVGGVLAVSRAFGDRLLKQYVVADPEIQEEKIDDSLEFLILASDGLWDVFSNEEAVAVVKEVEDPEESAKKLVGEAIRRGSADNITCVVVRFLESKIADNISSDHASSSKEPNQEPTAVRNEADHKISAKETNQDHNAVHSDVDHNTKNENLKQKTMAATSDNSGHSISTQKPNAITAAERSVSSEQSGLAGSEPKSSAKKPGQGQTTVHKNLDNKTKQDHDNENLNQKPVAAKSNNSGYLSSSQKPVANTAAKERNVSSEQSGSAVEKQIPNTIRSVSEPKSSTKVPDTVHKTNQDHTSVHRGLDRNAENENLNQKPIAARGVKSSHISSTQKPIAITESERSIPSEQRCSAGEKNHMPIAAHSTSESKSAAKVHDQDNDLDRSIAQQRQKIAETRILSSEKKCSAGEKNHIANHSGSEPKSSAKAPAERQITVENDLDCTIVNQKQLLAATLAASSEHSGSAVHGESATSKASTVPTISNYKPH